MGVKLLGTRLMQIGRYCQAFVPSLVRIYVQEKICFQVPVDFSHCTNGFFTEILLENLNNSIESKKLPFDFGVKRFFFICKRPLSTENEL